MGSVTITIPSSPAYKLSPNAREHHMAKHKDAQRLKHVAYLASREVAPIGGPVTLDWVIRLPKRRKKMDWDNALATLKPAMDGLVAALVIFDDDTDHVTRIGLTQIGWKDHGIDGGELEVTITPVKEANDDANQ